MPTGTLPVEHVSSVCLVKQKANVYSVLVCTLIRPPNIHVGGLTFDHVHGFFLSFFFFGQLPSELAEQNSIKTGHMLGSHEVSAI